MFLNISSSSKLRSPQDTLIPWSWGTLFLLILQIRWYIYIPNIHCTSVGSVKHGHILLINLSDVRFLKKQTNKKQARMQKWNKPTHEEKSSYSRLLLRTSCRCSLSAHRAILRWTWQEELQQLQNVPVVPARLWRGALRGRTCPPDPVLPRWLRQPVASIQSQHQLRGFLLHHTEAFKQGEQVHRLPWLLGVKTKQAEFARRARHWPNCVVVWKVEDACERVCICVESVLNSWGSVWRLQLLMKWVHVNNNADKPEQ